MARGDTKAEGRDYSKEAAYLRRTVKQRVERNRARREAMKKGLVRVGDGKDVDHITPISQGGTSTPGNVRVVTDNANRSFARNSDSSMRHSKRK